MKISIIGTGYVGLVSGACLAAKGHEVICVDRDQAKIDCIRQGKAPIHERGLEPLLAQHIGNHLQATTDLAMAVHRTDLSMIAVDTPFNGQEIDLTSIRTVSGQIGHALRNKASYHLVVVKSTVVPGTTDHVVRPELERTSGKQAGIGFGVGMNPEFLREGEAVHDFLFPDRIILGGIDETSLNIMSAIYQPFPSVEIIRTTPKTAEMTKYTSNAFLATMISFSNEIGNLCAAHQDVDVTDVMRGLHLDRRFKVTLPSGETRSPAFTQYLQAGCGFGGSCLPKDVKALSSHGASLGQPMPLLDTVMSINESQPNVMLSLLQRHLPQLCGRRIAILGLAFKPGTNDIRESPAIPILSALLNQGARIQAYDPVATSEMQQRFAGCDLQFSETLDQAIEHADAIMVLTSWEAFQALPHLIRDREPPPVVIDGRRMFDPNSITRYAGIGFNRSRDIEGSQA